VPAKNNRRRCKGSPDASDVGSRNLVHPAPREDVVSGTSARVERVGIGASPTRRCSQHAKTRETLRSRLDSTDRGCPRSTEPPTEAAPGFERSAAERKATSERHADVATDEARLAYATADATQTHRSTHPPRWELPRRIGAHAPPHRGGTTNRDRHRSVDPLPHQLPTRPDHRETTTAAIRCRHRNSAHSAPDGAASLRSRPCRPESEDSSPDRLWPVTGLGSQETLAKRRPSGKMQWLPSVTPSVRRTSRPYANAT
jgi:hypothetical protein